MISGLNEQLQQQLEYTLLKPDFHSWRISKMQSGREDTLEERYAIKLCFKLGKNATETHGMLQTAWIEHQLLSGIRDSRKAGNLWGIMRGVGGVRKSIHQSWLAKGLSLGLGFLCWDLKEVKEEIPSEEASTLQIGQWHFHQDNTPVHNSILVTNYLTKMDIKTVPHHPYSPDLAPCDFSLFRKLRELSLWDNWGDERSCDAGHWYAHTRGLPWIFPEGD